jgi:hypothetical protein
MRYRARYHDAAGREVSRSFADKQKTQAQRWLDEVTASQMTGAYVDPRTARTTVAEWCEAWLVGYATRRARTVRQAPVYVAGIIAAFGFPALVGGPTVGRPVVDGRTQGRWVRGQLSLRAALEADAGHE